MGQTSLSLAANANSSAKRNSAQVGFDASRDALKVIYANDEELQAHDTILNKIQQESEMGCVWLKDKST